MPRIRVLPGALANQIAAGEVVERPAAVVKELVENALDAGATDVEIDLAEGGIKLVRVRDDGQGMGREDAALSVERHATSKLRDKDDLFAISTYGFRGEALPSIAAVSRFTLLTCERGALGGTRIRIDGGQLAGIEEAGAPAGTTVEVKDLFWNLPARRKFLKRPGAEQAQAIESVLRIAIPRLDVGFTVREGARTLFRSAAGADLRERAAEALGREASGALLPFDSRVRGLRAWGLAASPGFSASSARGVWLFVNGRAIRDRQLIHAVLRAYGEVLPHGRYPAALVFLEVPPAAVDVNVHPAKSEVRLADGRAAYDAILSGIGSLLVRGAFLAPAPEPSGVAEAIAAYAERSGLSGTPGAWHAPPGGALASGPGMPAQPPLLDHPPFFSGLRYLGQLHRTYLVCEGPRGLVLIDQHAAHERMNYQRLRRAPGAGQQRLLVPLMVSLPAHVEALLAECREAVAAAGIEVEPFGGGQAAVKSLPALLAGLSGAQVAALLADLAEELSSRGRAESLARLTDALLARAACHASVRAHDALAPGEAQALLSALDATDYGARCAHGRPVVAEWTVPELDKRFGRDYESHPHAAAPEAL